MTESDNPRSTATFWLSLIARDPDPVRLMLLGWWLRASPKNRDEFVRACERHEALSGQLSRVRSVVLRLPIDRSRPFTRFRYGAIWSIGILALLALVQFLVSSPALSGDRKYQTEVGGYARVAMPPAPRLN